ncbi:hypothetical protein CCP2SC5_1350001 [Azospirillaceae bacterium]
MTFGEIIAEAAEQSFAGGLFKMFEVGPKVLTIYTAYKTGDHVSALSLGAGTIVEVALLTSLIEVLGIPELFLSSAALTAEWSLQVIQAALGTIVSSKAAILTGETIEEITKERFTPENAHAPTHDAPSAPHKGKKH